MKAIIAVVIPCFKVSGCIVYNYYLRDFNLASFALIFGIILSFFGFTFGAHHWITSIENNVFASAGTVMLASIPLLMGFGLLALFFSYDLSKQNTIALQKRILLERKQNV